jgi:hypothetical protein
MVRAVSSFRTPPPAAALNAASIADKSAHNVGKKQSGLALDTAPTGQRAPGNLNTAKNRAMALAAVFAAQTQGASAFYGGSGPLVGGSSCEDSCSGSVVNALGFGTATAAALGKLAGYGNEAAHIVNADAADKLPAAVHQASATAASGLSAWVSAHPMASAVAGAATATVAVGLAARAYANKQKDNASEVKYSAV